jgi:hypothetical protein
VIDAARAGEHPLHARFEWDDAIAGEKFRLQQARALIRVVREKFLDGRGDPQTVRVYHSLPDSEGHAYRPVDEVVENPMTRKLLLQQMERDWRTLRVRYQKFREFSDLILADLQKIAAEEQAAG